MTSGSRLELAVGGPFDPEPLLASLAAHAVPGVEHTDVVSGTTRRLLDLGRPVDVTVHLTPEVVTVSTGALTAAEAARLERLVRAWFDLDAPVPLVADRLGRDPVLAGLLGRRPGLRVLGHPSAWEAAVQTVVGQQVSVAAGRTFAGRLVAHFGLDGPGGLRRFPGPEELAAAGPVRIQEAAGLTGARARTVHALAELCAAGLRLSGDVDPGEARRLLLAVPGIGPWTVDYLAVRAMGDRDAFPAGDLVLRRALGVDDPRELARRAEGWAPFRAYAACHLWASAGWLTSRRAPSG